MQQSSQLANLVKDLINIHSRIIKDNYSSLILYTPNNCYLHASSNFISTMIKVRDAKL